MEGTGSWGAGLARWLRAEGLVVIEVNRPRRKLRRHATSDAIDAEAAARAVLSGEATAVPKTVDGPVEMIWVLRLTRRSAVHNRTMTANQINALVITAPDALPDQPAHHDDPAARRHDREVPHRRRAHHGARGDPLRAARARVPLSALDRADHPPLRAAGPPRRRVRSRAGGQGRRRQTHRAALLVTAGDNPQRLAREGSFAHLTGSPPLDASSGKQQRHRLNCGATGMRTALLQIALTRSSKDENPKRYLQRRIAEGKTKKEAFR